MPSQFSQHSLKFAHFLYKFDQGQGELVSILSFFILLVTLHIYHHDYFV